MPRRNRTSVDEAAVLEAMGECRDAIILLAAAYGPKSGVYRECRHLTEAMDSVGTLLTGDKRYFHLKPHSTPGPALPEGGSWRDHVKKK